MVIPMMSVARHLPKKKSTTSTTKRRAYMTDSSRELIEFWIVSARSYIFSTLTSDGSCFWIFASSSRTSLHTCTVLAPVCLAMIRRTASRPLVFSSRERSLMVSLTVAMSRMKTCWPCGVMVTMRSSISEDSIYSERTCIWYCSCGILTVPEERLRLFACTTCPTCSMVKP